MAINSSNSSGNNNQRLTYGQIQSLVNNGFTTSDFSSQLAQGKSFSQLLSTSLQNKASGGSTNIANGYKIHTFLASDTLIVNRETSIEYLIVAGGGGGGGAGGGGAGGVISGNTIISPST
jgi:hypothetical protein